MLHPLFHLITSQPQLLGDHAQAYGELISTELAVQAQDLKRRTIWSALALCLIGVAAVLAGVATMMWALLIPPMQAVPWSVILVPLVPAVLALACGLMARKSGNAGDTAFAELRRQLHADMALLRSMDTA